MSEKYRKAVRLAQRAIEEPKYNQSVLINDLIKNGSSNKVGQQKRAAWWSKEGLH